MSARVVCTVTALLLIAAAGCGQHRAGREDRSGDAEVTDADSGEQTDGGKAGRDGAAGRPAANGGGGRGGRDGRHGGGGREGEAGDAANALTVVCGASTCASPAGGVANACCIDDATGTCGVSVLGRCVQPPEDAFGCPELDFSGVLSLPNCCTSRGMCGIDVSSVGGPGCLDLATAAERARLAGATVVFPAPRACDGTADDDAGVTEDAGR